MVYTQWCNERGGIEADLTVTRLGETEFLVVTGSAPQIRDHDWLKRHIGDRFCTVTDVTSGMPMLSLMGPNSRALMEKLTGDRHVKRGSPLRHLARAGNRLCAGARQPHHLCGRAGLGALHALPSSRSMSMTPSSPPATNSASPCRHAHHEQLPHREGLPPFRPRHRRRGHALEAGLGFTIAWDKKGGFIGRDALLKQKEQNVRTKRMVTLALRDDSDAAPMMYHEEPVYRDGVIVGATTSGAWGHRIGKSIGMGYMKCEDGVTKDWIDSGKWEVEIAWKRYPIDVQLAPFYDPKNEKIRC
jgi:glycine cleavage system aminomethyltransferase T